MDVATNFNSFINHSYLGLCVKFCVLLRSFVGDVQCLIDLDISDVHKESNRCLMKRRSELTLIVVLIGHL